MYFHLLSLALVNATKHYVMQNSEPSNQLMPLSAFLKAAIKELVGTRSRIQVEGLSSPITRLETDTSWNRSRQLPAGAIPNLNVRFALKKEGWLLLKQDPLRAHLGI